MIAGSGYTLCGARSDERAVPAAAARSFLPVCIAWIDCTLRTTRQMSALRRICGALGAPCCYGVCLALHELFELMVCELFASGGDRAFRVDDYGILGAWSAR
jgi:hypothetical protein